MKFLFVFSALYFSYVVGCITDPIATMNELISYSGWRVLANANDGLYIIDRRQDTGQLDRLFRWEHLATKMTEENVAEKIRLIHQFLSCSYARVLIDLSDYERGIGAHCRSKPTTFDCLMEYLDLIKYKHTLVSRMIGALSALQDLSPAQTQLQTAVFTVLVDMRKYYQHKTVVIPAGKGDLAIKEFAVQECLGVEKHAHLMSKRSFAFYNRFCWPISQCVRDDKCSNATSDVKGLVEGARLRNNGLYVMHMIEQTFETIVRKFKDAHDNTSGFEYDPEPNTTRIISHDPDTAVRVIKLNQLLSHAKWKSLELGSTRERGSPNNMRVQDLLKRSGGPAIVNRENVYTKLKLAHLLLSCKYALILKTCCRLTAAMWTICKKSQDTVCLDKFLQILNENDPSVMRMVDALLCFQKISPNTAYNKNVYESLLSFKSFYDKRTALPQNTRNVKRWSRTIEKDISEITRATDEFHTQFCSKKDELNDYYIGGDTIDVIGATFIKYIDQYTSDYAVFEDEHNSNVFLT